MKLRVLLKNRHYQLKLRVRGITVEDYSVANGSTGRVVFHHDIRIYTRDGEILDVCCSAPSKAAVTEAVPADDEWLRPKVYNGNGDED